MTTDMHFILSPSVARAKSSFLLKSEEGGIALNATTMDQNFHIYKLLTVIATIIARHHCAIKCQIIARFYAS